MLSADNTLLDLLNSSDDTQPHPIIVISIITSMTIENRAL